ncbi:hypothetical protein PHYC_00029 [Phycisphaerales bacterium]|nr:hypothetical protein PHYC_00029 [Phycisphaerales bacterium]
MGAFSGQVVVVLAVILGIAVLAILHSLATGVRNDTYLHDLRLRVSLLRKEQLERLQRLAERATSQPRTASHPPTQPPQRKAA